MNPMMHLTYLVLTACLMLSFAGSAPVSPPSPSLEGTWEIVVTPDPMFGIPPATNVSTAMKNGSIVDVDTYGSGVGEWKRLSGSRFAVTFHGFLDLHARRARALPVRARARRGRVRPVL